MPNLPPGIGVHDIPGNERDSGYAPERWDFDEEVSLVFDDMLSRSIPQYETMREAVTLVASAYLKPFTIVVDLGCSQGEVIAGLRAVAPDMTYVGLEISEPMLEIARARFVDAGASVSIRKHDLRKGVKGLAASHAKDASVFLSVLTLMFVPVNYRQRLLWECDQQLAPGGALILVEKVLGETAETDDLFNAAYHRKKVESGYTPDDVERKRLSLEGVLVPMPASFNEAMLLRAGFRNVERFWQWMNFAGWVATA